MGMNHDGFIKIVSQGSPDIDNDNLIRLAKLVPHLH